MKQHQIEDMIYIKFRAKLNVMALGVLKHKLLFDLEIFGEENIEPFWNILRLELKTQNAN